MNATLRRLLPPAAAATSAAAACLALSSPSPFTTVAEPPASPSAERRRRQAGPPVDSNGGGSSGAVLATSDGGRGGVDGRPKLLFLGTGSSTGCPKPLCSLLFSDGGNADNGLAELRRRAEHRCHTSRLASRGDPAENRNYRNNPSLLIAHRNGDDAADDDGGGGEVKLGADGRPPLRNVVIDVGKTFREGALRWMPRAGVRSLDAVVLTHEHADAVFGLDDVRGFQKGPWMWHGKDPPPKSPLPVFLSKQCFERIKIMFDYLVPKDPNNATGIAMGGKNVVRSVASLKFETVEPFKPFIAAGLRMIPLPVMHGEDLVCLGFAFTVKSATAGGRNLNVVYLSDISRMLEATEKFIRHSLPPTDLLILDSLLLHQTHPVHFSLDQALALVGKLKPKQTYIVGMNCDDFLPHDEMNKKLSQLELNVKLAHDGLVVHV